MRTEEQNIMLYFFGISEDVGDLACGYITRQGRSYLMYPSDKKATESVKGGSKTR